MNETAYNQLIIRLAAGDEGAARRYLMHFPRKDRVPAVVRTGLACRVAPEVMEFFERLAPWLTSHELDDTSERIRRVLAAAGRMGLRRSQLRDKVPGLAPSQLRVVLGQMVRAREVHIERKRTAGRSANVFRLREFAAGIQPANLNEDPFAYVVPPPH